MIVSSFVFLLLLGLAAAVLLAVAAKFLHVEEDPRVAALEAVLPGANCGGCGYPGCAAAAAAAVAGQTAGASFCVAGGPEVHQKVAGILGLQVLLSEPEMAFHDCFGGTRAEAKYRYEGVADCRAQALLYGGDKACGRGCLGLGSCVRACPFGALAMGPQGVPVIDPDLCRACGKCAEVCPRGIITIASLPAKILHMNTMDDCLAPCRQICPAQLNIPQYIEDVKNGDYARALAVIRLRMPLPLSIGRVCPAPCEGYCRRALVDEPIGINYLKRFVADWELRSGRREPIPCARDTGRRVAVIGGGPAGLSCAYFLRRLGHSPVIFDSMPALGGQLRYGIPEYRLPKAVLDWEIEGIQGLGIEARPNMRFGQDFTLDSLRAEGFQAFFLGLGAWVNARLGVEGEDAPGVMGGTEYLTTVALGGALPPGRKVVVVGGGNTAIDAARTARRLGAQVTILYRRGKAEMPANKVEIHAAEEEGVQLKLLAAPTRVLLGEGGRVSGLEYVDMELGEPDASGRRRPEPKLGSEQTLPCDLVIPAIGQKPDTCYIEEQSPACGITRWKTVSVNPETMQTAVPEVFAAGDLVSGPALVVTAIGGGRRAARGIHYFLLQGEIPVPENLQKAPLPETLFTELSGVRERPRVRQPELCAEDRVCNFKEVEESITPEQAQAEAERCLRCGLTCYTRDVPGLAVETKTFEHELPMAPARPKAKEARR